MPRHFRTWLPLTACLLAGSLLAAGCASTGNTNGADSASTASGDIRPGLITADAPSDDPQSGGDFRYSTFTGVKSLDPADRQDGGATGGTEMAAIYDLLMRYESDSQKYVPQLAKGIEANADNTVWTLSLRDSATFSDGSEVDADSVVWSIEHYLEKRGTHAQIWDASVAKTDATDTKTVEFTLRTPWPDFPTLLTTGPGMVVAPSSMESGDFKPIGAGPFEVTRFDSQDNLILAARDDYWDGRPYLDTLQFPVILSEDAKLDALRAGDIDAAYLRTAEVVRNALEVIPDGYIHSINMGSVLVVNQREGMAAADDRVRRAIVAGVDPDRFDERADSGTGWPGSDMFQEWSRWHGDVRGDGYDPKAAKEYLETAMADGYDGHLTYVGLNAPYALNRALAFQSMLQSVGFTVTLDLKPTMGDLITQMYVKGDYDIGESGFNVSDESPLLRLFSNLHSESTGNVVGLDNTKIDNLIAQLQQAQSDDAQREVLAQLQSEVNEVAPFVTVGAGNNFIPWKNVTGVVPSGDGIMLFGKASKT